MGRSFVLFSRQKGFTLLEAVVSLGVFALGVSVVLGVLTIGSNHVREIESRSTAAKMMGQVNAKLQVIGFDALKEQLSVDVSEQILWVADLKGNILCSIDDVDVLLESEQFFLVTIDYFDQTSGSVFNQANVLFFDVQIFWPFRTPATSGYCQSDEGERSNFQFVASLRP